MIIKNHKNKYSFYFNNKKNKTLLIIKKNLLFQISSLPDIHKIKKKIIKCNIWMIFIEIFTNYKIIKLLKTVKAIITKINIINKVSLLNNNKKNLNK